MDGTVYVPRVERAHNHGGPPGERLDLGKVQTYRRASLWREARFGHGSGSRGELAGEEVDFTMVQKRRRGVSVRGSFLERASKKCRRLGGRSFGLLDAWLKRGKGVARARPT
jgi:hypothetical protein